MKSYPAYKEENNPLLGRIPNHWSMTKLKFVADIQGRVGYKGYKKTDLVSEGKGAISIGGKNITNNKLSLINGTYISWEKYYESPEIMVSSGDIVFAQRGTLGKVAQIIDDIGEATINPSLVLLKNIKLIARFLYYFLINETIQQTVDLISTATAVPMISQEQLGSFNLTLPPLEEQQAIADYLDRKTAVIDSLIAKKERQIALLQEQRTAVINTAVTKGLNPHAPRKDSGIPWLGQIPAHWETGKFQYVTTLVQTGPFGSQLHFSDYVENKTPIINPSNIQDMQIVPDWGRCVTQEALERLSRHRLNEGDIVFGRRGEMGRCALVTNVEDGWLCGTGSLKLSLEKSRAYPPYIMALLSTQGIREWLELESVGSTMANLNTEIISRMPIPLISLEEQQEIVTFIEDRQGKFDKLIQNNLQLIEKLREYRTAVISAAVTGKIDVREAVPSP